MTNDEILAMEPGIELDDFVAEKVMNWHKGAGYWLDNKNNNTWYRHDELDYDNNCFEPSQYISAAWKVVNKLLDNTGIDIEIKNTLYREWMAVIMNDEKVIALAEAKTAPEAICKAALLAYLKEATQCK